MNNIDKQIGEWRRNQWPVGMMLCFGATLLWYAMLGHELRTFWEKAGFVSMVGAGIVNGVMWAIRNKRAENDLRAKLKAETPESKP